VGGMLFVHLALRPALVETVEPPLRLFVWRGVLKRFLSWVWLSLVVLHATGYWMLFQFMGGMAGARIHVHVMLGIAWLMTLLFAHLYFVPFARFKRALDGGQPPLAAQQMPAIRRVVTINLVLGLIVVVVGAAGRYWS
ncbi:MAG: CopD family protein, partial [Planctomycetes bacterium]|nr:CopD family protein [Planctomycetota bacterium]